MRREMRLFRPLAMLPALLLFAPMAVKAQQTPPIQPKVQDVAVPPVVTIPGVKPPEDVPNRPLSADEAARIALRHQPTVTEARAGITAAQGRTQQARSGLLPNLNVNASYTHVQTLSNENKGGGSSTGGTNTGTGGTNGSGTSTTSTGTKGFLGTVNLRQLLFDYNHTRDLVRQSSALERAASQNLSRVQSDLVFQVKQAYYAYAQSSDLVTINEENLRNRQL